MAYIKWPSNHAAGGACSFGKHRVEFLPGGISEPLEPAVANELAETYAEAGVSLATAEEYAEAKATADRATSDAEHQASLETIGTDPESLLREITKLTGERDEAQSKVRAAEGAATSAKTEAAKHAADLAAANGRLKLLEDGAAGKDKAHAEAVKLLREQVTTLTSEKEALAKEKAGLEKQLAEAKKKSPSVPPPPAPPADTAASTEGASS